MKITSSAEYIKTYADTPESAISRMREIGLNKQADFIETKKIRANVLREIQYAANITLDVANDLEPDVIAYATPDNQNGIAEEALDDKEASLHGAEHEANHQKTGIFDLPVENISAENKKFFCEEFNVPELTDTILIEGLNERKTFNEKGRFERSGYAQKEVPLAEKLENLIQKKFHISLQEAFNNGDKEKVITTIERLITSMRIEKTLGLTLDELPTSNATNDNFTPAVQAFQAAAIAA